MKTTSRHAIRLLAMIAVGITATQATPIALNNPSLESGGSAGTIPNDFDGWTESGPTGKSTVAHSGSYGLWNCWGSGWNSLFQQGYTVAAAGETITASVWAKTDTNLGSGWASFNLSLKVGNDWAAFAQPAYQGGQDWTQVTTSYVTKAADIGKTVGISFGTDGGPGGGNPGYVYMDDASLSMVSPVNTWTNASGDFKWNNDDFGHEGRNWTLLSPSPQDSSMQPIWVNGYDAVFGAAGAGAISLDTVNTVHNLTVNAAGYTFSNAPLTFAGATPTLTANAAFGLGAPLAGSSGLTIQGTGTVLLNPTSPNTYTGGTRVLGGTVILKASTTAGSSATAFALNQIVQLDAGATVKYYNELQASPLASLTAPNGQLYNKTDMIMTGGTFDLNGDNNQNQMPAPSGYGVITNSSPNDRAVLKIGALANTTREFSGIIQDGGTVVDSPISGKVGFRTDIDMANFDSNTAEIVFSGPNTYTGSTRRGGGHLKLKGAGTLGVVTARTPSIGLRINGDINLPAEVDFNGTSQRVSGMGGNGGKIVNDMAGTISVLTLGVAPGQIDTGVPSWVGSFRDNTGTGGILAVTKIGPNKQILTGSLHSYSGPTRINEGTIEFGAAAAPSPNSDLYVTSPGSLSLLYSGSKPIKRLFLNGVQVGLGTYDAASYPNLISGPGSIQVTDATPVTITISQSGSNVTVTWTGGGLLQESTTLSDWTDKPGVVSPYVTPVAGARKFFRIKE